MFGIPFRNISNTIKICLIRVNHNVRSSSIRLSPSPFNYSPVERANQRQVHSSLLLPLSSHKSHKLSSPSPTGGPTESATIRQTARAMESGKAEAALPTPRAPHRRKSLGWGAGATLTPVFLLQSSLLKLLSTRAVVVGCPCVLTGMPARPAMGRRRAVAESSNSNRSPDSDLIPSFRSVSLGCIWLQ